MKIGETEEARFLSAKERARRWSSGPRMSPSFCPVARLWQILCTTRFGLPFIRELPVIQGEALTAPVKVQDDGEGWHLLHPMPVLNRLWSGKLVPCVQGLIVSIHDIQCRSSSIGENIEEYNKKFDKSGMDNLEKWATARELFAAGMWLDCDVYTYTLSICNRFRPCLIQDVSVFQAYISSRSWKGLERPPLQSPRTMLLLPCPLHGTFV